MAECVIDSAGTFASGAETLDNTSLRMQRLMEDMSVSQALDAERINAMLAELEESFNQFKKAEEKFWEELD